MEKCSAGIRGEQAGVSLIADGDSSLLIGFTFIFALVPTTRFAASLLPSTSSNLHSVPVDCFSSLCRGEERVGLNLVLRRS